MRARSVLGALWVLLSVGCGANAFNAGFQEREEPEFSRVLEELGGAEVRPDRPIVVAVTRDTNGLLAWDLREGRRLWMVDTEARSTPIAAGAYVVTMEPRGAVVRRASDGQRAFSVDDGELALVGADGEGERLVMTLARGQSDSPPGVVVGANRGSQTWMEEMALPVAVPAIVGGIVVVPWAQQRVSFLDAEEGRERARLRLEDAVVGHAFRHQGAVFLGQHELFEVDAQLAESSRRGDDFVCPQGRPLPGQPPLMADGYERRVAPDSARNRVRLAWALETEEEGVAFTDDLLYFVFYRMVFGLEAGADEARWVSVLPSDAVGADVVSGGILVATEDGTLRLLSARDGREGWRADLGAPIRAADVHARGLEVSMEVTGDADPLRVQLHRAASLEDPRLDGGRALAIRYLTRFTEDEITAQLIPICAQRTPGGPARRAACDALAERRNGQSHVRAALDDRASFLEDTPAPPVGALARASANMNYRTAVPFLLRHLEDPATPVEELPGLFEGLARLGDARTANAIADYLRLYHADATDGREIEALGAAAAALLALDPNRFAAVQELAADPLAPEPVRERIARALTQHRADSQPAQAPAQPEVQARPRPQPPPPPDPSLPERLTDEMRRAALRPVEARLTRCLEPQGAEPHPSARIAFTIDDEGRPQTVSVSPAALQACIEPIIRSRTFPRTRRGAESLTHIVRH
jgi:hypothetical protein